MKAADRLGAGTAFANARDPRNRAKAQAQGDIPMYDLVTLRLSEVAPTPLNPRRHFGSDEDLLTLGRSLASAQLQPCVAVPTAAYLKLWPEHTGQVRHAKHVLINGERRWRAAQKAELETLDFTLRGDLAVIHDGDLQGARARLLDAVLKENIDRQNFDAVEEARGVAALVLLYGDGVRAGQKLGRSKGWVSQRLALLALPEDLQDRVSTGTISINDGRWLGPRAKADPALTSEQLLQLLTEHQEEQQRKAAPRFTAVNPDSAHQGPKAPAGAEQDAADREAGKGSSPPKAPDDPSRFTAVNPADSPETGEAAPGPPNHRTTVVNPRPPAEGGYEQETPASGPAGFTAVNPAPAPGPDWEDPDSIAAEILRRFSPEDVAGIARFLTGAHDGNRPTT